MNKTITLEFPEKKLEALSHFLAKKDTTVNTELAYALSRLYVLTTGKKTSPACCAPVCKTKPVAWSVRNPRVRSTRLLLTEKHRVSRGCMARCGGFPPKVGKVPDPAPKRPVWAPCAEPNQRIAP